MRGSFEFLKLLLTIFTEKSVEPIANKLELGWKLNEIIGVLVKLELRETTQHF